jgi:class 3 adenylate cyclase
MLDVDENCARRIATSSIIRLSVGSLWLQTMRIGMHCGPVIAGVVGKRKFLYDIWGDAVSGPLLPINNRVYAASKYGHVCPVLK